LSAVRPCTKLRNDHRRLMDKILSQFAPSQKELISILHAVQAKYGYVPTEAVAGISRFLRISEGEIFGVLTFYKGFSLVPRGKFLVTVWLGIKLGETTPDRSFTLEAVNCLGCCAIGPVVAINGDYYGHATIRNVETILEKYMKPPAASTQAPG
jgi:NADH-quinone oxidoreductase subunit E